MITDTVRDLNTHHLFTPPASREAWEARARDVRGQILFGAGLWPMPPKTPLRPRVTGRVEGPDYSIENVAIETYPGFYLCGNLYRPKSGTGPFPTIVNPHGHWAQGRLQRGEDVPRAAPPPAPPAEGRADLVAIGVNLARQGFVVFAYDAVGYNDTDQLPKHREVANGLQPWLWNVSLMGLQLWNSIRAVDYLETLPDVDRSRIGATGASGGATQTFLLTAVDERIRAAVPVNMVSAHMQGGCLCENGPGLRRGTDNVEIAALMAPKPLLLVAATGDWTKNNPHEEWPAIKRVYDLYGAGDRTQVRQFNYGHNYNVESREAMYAWFARWLRNDPDADVTEKPFTIDPERLRVWTEQNPRPADAKPEAELVRALIAASEGQLAGLLPVDTGSLKRFRETYAPALRHALGVTVPAELQTNGGKAVLVVTGEQTPIPDGLPEALRARGYRVALLTLPLLEDTPERLWNGFFTGYNRTALGDRVQRILDEVAGLKGERVGLVGLGPAGLWTLLARGLVPGGGRTVVDTDGFEREKDQSYIDRLYAPGLRRAGDVRAAALLAAPAPLCLFNTGSAFTADAIAGGYRSLNAPLRVEQGALSAAEIAAWLSGD